MNAAHRLPAALVAAALLGACAPSRMALPPTLAKEAKPMAVRKTYRFWFIGLKALDFGEYKVRDYRSGWQQGSGSDLGAGSIGYAADKSTQKYGFKLAAGGGPAWTARCAESASKRTVSGKVLGGTLSADLERQATLDCTFQVEQGTTPWTLSLSLQSQGKGLLTEASLAGVLSDGTRSLNIVGTHRLEGLSHGNGEPAGYALLDDGKALGAVQVIDKPMVWMDPAAMADLGTPMALAGAALMLQEGLLKQLEEKKD